MAKHQTKAEKAHVNKVAELGCVACFVQAGVWETPGQIHHIREGMGMSQRSSWFDVICLCQDHHLNGENGKIAVHLEPVEFAENYGPLNELLELTQDNI